jgi:hypothetical protein
VIVMVFPGVKTGESTGAGFIAASATILLYLLLRFWLINRFYKSYSIRIDDTGIFHSVSKRVISVFYADLGGSYKQENLSLSSVVTRIRLSLCQTDWKTTMSWLL